jgi:hypothetical protein
MKTKATKKYPFTLGDISDLLDNKIGILETRLDVKLNTLETRLTGKINQSATGIIAEMDKRFGLADSRFDEVDKRFDMNDDAHQEIIGAIDEMSDRKIKQHCQKFHTVVS